MDLDRALFKEVLALKLAGAIKENPEDHDRFIVTDKGKLLGLVMMKDFYSAMDNIRAELRKPLKEADHVSENHKVPYPRGLCLHLFSFVLII